MRHKADHMLGRSGFLGLTGQPPRRAVEVLDRARVLLGAGAFEELEVV